MPAENDQSGREAVLLEQNKLLKHLLDASEAGHRAKPSKTVNEWHSLWDKPRAERPGWRERLTATIAPTGTDRADRRPIIAAAAAVGDVDALQRHMVLRPRTVRVNLIGTADDTQAERAVLKADVFPYLTRLCRSQGVELAVEDLSELDADVFALANDASVQASLTEARRAYDTPLSTFTLVLCTDRPARHPLPGRVPASLLSELRRLLEKRDRRHPNQLPAASLLDKWYKCEPQSTWFALTEPAARDATTTEEAETLIGCMHKALKLLHRKNALPVALLQPYVLPITELQVAAALAGSGDGTVAGGGEGDVQMWDTAASAEAVKHTLMVDRRLSDVALYDPLASTYVDVRELQRQYGAEATVCGGRGATAALWEQRLRHLLAGYLAPDANVVQHSVRWGAAGPDPHSRRQSLREMADGVATWMFERIVAANALCATHTAAGAPAEASMLSACSALASPPEAMVDAACATVTLVREFVNVGEGAPETQRQLMEYVDGVAPCPLVLTGASEWGLTCALAKAAEQAWLREPHGVAVLARYCHLQGGATATQQPSLEQLLHSVSQQLEVLASGCGDGGGSPVLSMSTTIADDYCSLVAAMPERMRAAATAERPLMLFLDGLHLLKPAVEPATTTGGGMAAHALCHRNLDWLPSPLPPHVRVVVSIALVDAEAEVQAATHHLTAALVTKWGAVVERSVKTLAPMPAESWMEAAYHWSHADGALPDHARDALYTIIGTNPDHEFIRLVYPLVLAHVALHPDVPAALPVSRHEAAHATLARVETLLGASAAGLVLGCLTAASQGVSFSQLREMVLCDRADGARAAAAVSAVQRELAGLLVESVVTGRARWRFSSLRRAAEERYLTDEKVKLRISEAMLAYHDPPAGRALRFLDAADAAATGGDLWSTHRELLTEVVPALLLGGRAHQAADCVCDVGYVMAHFASPSGATVLLLQYEAVVRALDRTAAAAAASRTRAFWHFVVEERQLLRRFPSLVAQQAMSQVRTRTCVSKVAERWRVAALAARPASPAAALPALRWLNPHPRASLCRASYEPSADTAASQPCGAIAFSRSAVGGLEVPLCVSCPPHGGVLVWNLLTGECVHTLQASHLPERMVAVAFSPDGTTLVSAGQEGSLLIWSTTTWQCEGYLEWTPATTLAAVAFSADGEHLAAASCDGRAAVWEVVSWRLLHQWHAHDGDERMTSMVTALAWAPDKAVLATSGSDGVVKLWSFLAGMTVGLSQAAWAAGQLTSALAALEASMTVEQWQTEGHPHSHTLVKLFSVEGPALASMCVAVGVDADVVVQGRTDDNDDDASWVSALRVSWEPLGAPYLAAFDRVAVLRQSRPRVVETQTISVTHTGAVVGCCWSPDGRSLLTLAADGMLDKLTRAPGAASMRVRHSMATSTVSGGEKNDSAAPLWLAVVPSYATDDDHLLVATAHADGSVRLWDAQLQPAGAILSSSSSGPRRKASSSSSPSSSNAAAIAAPSTRFDVSACGAWLLGGGDDGALRVWNVEVARLPVEVTHDGPVVGCDVSDAGLVVALGADRALRLWTPLQNQDPHAPSTHVEYTPYTQVAVQVAEALGFALSADGRWAAVAAGDDGLRVYDVNRLTPATKTCEPVLTFAEEAAAGSTSTRAVCCAYSADCSLLLTAGEDAATGHSSIKLFGDTQHSLPAQPHAVTAVALSPDGKWGATAHAGGEVAMSVWDLAGVTSRRAQVDHWRVYHDTNTTVAVVTSASRSGMNQEGAPSLVPPSSLPATCTSCAFSPCGSRLATTLNIEELRVYHVLGGAQAVRGSYAMQPMRIHDEGNEESAADGSHCAYSPNGDWIATAGGRMLRLWCASTGRRLGGFPLRASPTSLAVGAGGRVVAVGDTAGRVYVVQVLVRSSSAPAT